MSRFYVPPGNMDETQNLIFIQGEEAHHIIDVMRMKEADKVVVFDGTGVEYTGFIENMDARGRTVVVKVVKVDRPLPEVFPEITLAQALPKKHKMEYITEKATELGAAVIIPVISDRTIVRPDEGAALKKVARWRKIAEQTAKQCGRATVPVLSEIRTFREVINEFDKYDIVLLACLTDRNIPIKQAISGFSSGRIMVLIGPEGDFTPREINEAGRDNCRLISLGQRVLKSDTAGLFVLSVLGYEFSPR